MTVFLKSVEIQSDGFPIQDKFPFNIPSLGSPQRIDISAPVTFFVGQNGSGKSALMDALARKCGFLPWGGSKTHRSHENPYETALANHLSLEVDPHPPYGFHFRAEAFFNFASSLDDVFMSDSDRRQFYGGISLNVLSHGESFLRFFGSYSFQLEGLYLLDEPEAALSPENQVEFARMLLEGANKGNRQFIVATHSPIILGCPEAHILSFDDSPVRPITYRQTTHYAFYRDFLSNPEKFF